MEPTNILYYSRTGTPSQNLLDMVRRSPIILPLKYVCVDNKYTLNRLKSYKGLKIEKIPCIVSFFPDGRKKDYQGNEVFEMIQDAIQKTVQNRIEPPPQDLTEKKTDRVPPPYRERPRDSEGSSEKPKKDKNRRKIISSLPELNSSDSSDSESESEKQSRRRNKRPSNQRGRRNPNSRPSMPSSSGSKRPSQKISDSIFSDSSSSEDEGGRSRKPVQRRPMNSSVQGRGRAGMSDIMKQVEEMKRARANIDESRRPNRR